MFKRFPFTVDLYRFLIAEQYTHIHYRGIEPPMEAGFGLHQDNYILAPLKEDISLQFEEAEMGVEDIHSLDVREMLEYTPGIDFWVELPNDVALLFDQQNKD